MSEKPTNTDNLDDDVAPDVDAADGAEKPADKKVLAFPEGASVPPATPSPRRGEADAAGETVDRVHLVTDRFVIYSIKCPLDLRVRHTLVGTNYEDSVKLRERLSPLVGTMAAISDVVIGLRDTRDGGHEDLCERWMVIQSCAIRLAFENQGEAAQTLLGDFRGQVELRRDSRNRMYYIIANVVAIVVILGLWSAAGYLGLPTFLAWLEAPLAGAAVKPIDVLALGALGAFFSVSAGVNRVNVARSITMREMLYAGFVRIPIGVIAAAVTIFLIGGEWILGMVEPPLLVWTFYLFGFLAGFSEFFVPNALQQVETSTTVSVPASKAGAAANK